MGTLSIMDVKEGDIRVEWNPESDEEVEVAKKSYKDAIKKGYKAFRMFDSGKKGEQLDHFDATAEKILMVPPIMGG